MYRGIDNLTDLIASPFRTLSACTRSLAMAGLGLVALSPAGAQGLKPKPLPQPPAIRKPASPTQPTQTTPTAPDETAVRTKMLPPAIIPPLKAIKHPHVNRPKAQIDQQADTVTLPDGSKAPLSRMRQQFAQQEAQMNQMGLSLFDPNAPSLELAPDLDYNKLEAQRQELLQHKTNAHPTKAQPTNSKEQMLQAAGAGYFYRNYPWSWSLGDASLFQISLNSDLSVYGEPNYLYAYGSASADGTILGHTFNIASASAYGYSSSGYMGGNLTLSVLGDNIIDWSTSQSVNWSYSWYAEEEAAEPYHVWIGPIPVGGRVGVRGTVGSYLDLGLYGSEVYGGFDPYIALDGFAEAGVDIWFASAGIGGDLNFLTCDFPNDVYLYLSTDANGNPQLSEYVYSDIDLHALDGKFYVYAEIFGDYNYWTLWNWTGVQFNDTLYYDWQTIAL